MVFIDLWMHCAVCTIGAAVLLKIGYMMLGGESSLYGWNRQFIIGLVISAAQALALVGLLYAFEDNQDVQTKVMGRAGGAVRAIILYIGYKATHDDIEDIEIIIMLGLNTVIAIVMVLSSATLLK